MAKKTYMDDEDQTKTMPVSFRFQIRIIKMAERKATSLGMHKTAYIAQLIVKDCEARS